MNENQKSQNKEAKKRETVFETLNEQQKAVEIPYYLHEGEMNRLERLNKRWFIAFLIVLVMLFVTNAGWIIHESQYQDEVITVEQQVETGEGAAVVSGTGNAIYGEGNAENNDQAPGAEIEQQSGE